MTAFSISLMIILTLTYCINEQFKLVNYWEERVNADKIILMNLKSDNIPNPLIIKNQKYYYKSQKNSFQVEVNKHVYEIKK